MGTAQAAAHFGRHPSTIRRWCRNGGRGVFLAAKVGRCWVIALLAPAATPPTDTPTPDVPTVRPASPRKRWTPRHGRRPGSNAGETMATFARRFRLDLDAVGTRVMQAAALVLSAVHIITVALDHGASTLDAFAAPVIIDVPLLLCVRGMRPLYTKATRVTGLVGACSSAWSASARTCSPGSNIRPSARSSAHWRWPATCSPRCMATSGHPSRAHRGAAPRRAQLAAAASPARWRPLQRDLAPDTPKRPSPRKG